MGIVRTQNNFFEGRLTGCTPESGLDLPAFEKIANAYEIPYMPIEKNEDIDDKLNEFFKINGFAICELFEDSEQGPALKLASRKLDSGEMVSAPFDDLTPLLERNVYLI